MNSTGTTGWVADRVQVAAATAADLDLVVEVMAIAARSHLTVSVWERLLDAPADHAAALLRAVARSDEAHWCHLDRFWVATVDGRPAGALSTFDVTTEGNAALTDALVPAIVERVTDEDALAAVLERAAVLASCVPAAYPDAWGIENVAVLPAWRGTGVIDRLLEHALEEGRQAGYTLAQILTLDGNVRARRTWERHGFVARASSTHARFADVYDSAGMTLLARPLTDPAARPPEEPR